MTNVIEQLGAWVVIRIQEMGRMLLFVLSAFGWCGLRFDSIKS